MTQLTVYSSDDIDFSAKQVGDSFSTAAFSFRAVNDVAEDTKKLQHGFLNNRYLKIIRKDADARIAGIPESYSSATGHQVLTNEGMLIIKTGSVSYPYIFHVYNLFHAMDSVPSPVFASGITDHSQLMRFSHILTLHREGNAYAFSPTLEGESKGLFFYNADVDRIDGTSVDAMGTFTSSSPLNTQTEADIYYKPCLRIMFSREGMIPSVTVKDSVVSAISIPVALTKTGEAYTLYYSSDHPNTAYYAISFANAAGDEGDYSCTAFIL